MAVSRLSSLETSSVGSSSSTTSSSLTVKKTPVKKATVAPVLTRTIRSSNTSTASPIVSSRVTKTPLRHSSNLLTTSKPLSKSVTKPAATANPAFTKPAAATTKQLSSSLTKKRTTAPAASTARSVSRASNPSRAGTPNSNPSTMNKKKSVAPTISTSDKLAIQELNDKNNHLQSAISQNEDLLAEKEINIQGLKTKLQQLEQEIEENKTQLLKQQETDALVTEIKVAGDGSLLKLEEKIELLQMQSVDLKKSFDQEKAALIQIHKASLSQQQESAEEQTRESMQKLREKLEQEKSILNAKLIDKERDIIKLKKDMDEMRDDIQDMHRSHQTRLTNLSNQLTQQFAQSMDQLKSDYEDQLESFSKEKSLTEIEEKKKELELLELKFNNYIEASQKESEGLTETIESLKSNHSREIQKLKNSNADNETTYKAELNQCLTRLEITKAENERIEQERRKERANVASLKEEHSTMLQELKESYEDIISKLKSDHKAQLDLQNEQTLAQIEIVNQSRQTQINDLQNSHQSHVVELNDKIFILQGENVSLTREMEKIKEQSCLDLEKSKSRCHELNKALANAELRLTQDQLQNEAEFKRALNQLEAGHAIFIKDMKEQHSQTMEDFKASHKKELQLADSHLQSTRVKTEATLTQTYENKLQKLRDSEKLLKEDLFKTKNQLQTNRLEIELKHAEKLKLSASELSQKHDLLRSELEAQSQEKMEAERRLYLNEINELKQNIKTLASELKSCNERYKLSSQDLNKSILNEKFSRKELAYLHSEIDDLNENRRQKENKELKSVKAFFENLLAAKEKELRELRDKQKPKANDETTQVKLQMIIEQHQKELSILQNQFQNLLDMKDKELNDLSYRMKSKKGSTADTIRESKRLEQELRNQLYTLEEDMKSKSLEMRWLESDSEQNETKLKEQGILIHNLQLSNSKLENSIQQFKDENDQMLRLIHQLQGEIHQF